MELAHLAARVGETGDWQGPEEGVDIWPLWKVRVEGIQGHAWGVREAVTKEEPV